MEPKAAQSSPMTGLTRLSQGSGPSLAPRRNLEQNAKLWALLTDISEQVQWPVDGEMQWLTKEDWKVLLTAGLKREQRIAKGIWGGFVLLGTPTSRMTKAEFSELLELILAFGAERGVKFANEQLPQPEVT